MSCLRPLLLVLPFFLPACADTDETSASDSDSSDSSDSDGTGVDLDGLYQAAVEDAEIADEDEVVETLVALTPDNPELMYDEDDRVLMVTWTSWDGYDGLVGMATGLGVEVWMTPAPALQDFCVGTGLAGDPLNLRLEQLLGLPPGNGKDRVVLLWVPLSAMFRPAADAEIDDAVAEITLPDSATQEHVAWFEDLMGSSYGDGGYPWTRLGYTYDWHPDTSEVGLSEFVARAGSEVVVEAVVSTDDYCQ